MTVRSADYKVTVGEVMFNVRLEDVKIVVIRKTSCWDLLHKVAVVGKKLSRWNFFLTYSSGISSLKGSWFNKGDFFTNKTRGKQRGTEVQFCWIVHKSLTLTKNLGTFTWQKDKCPVLINCNHFHWVKRHNQFTKAVFQLITSILIQKK